jgi:hypothetical protein
MCRQRIYQMEILSRCSVGRVNGLGDGNQLHLVWFSSICVGRGEIKYSIKERNVNTLYSM